MAGPIKEVNNSGLQELRKLGEFLKNWVEKKKEKDLGRGDVPPFVFEFLQETEKRFLKFLAKSNQQGAQEVEDIHDFLKLWVTKNFDVMMGFQKAIPARVKAFLHETEKSIMELLGLPDDF